MHLLKNVNIQAKMSEKCAWTHRLADANMNKVKAMHPTPFGLGVGFGGGVEGWSIKICFLVISFLTIFISVSLGTNEIGRDVYQASDVTFAVQLIQLVSTRCPPASNNKSTLGLTCVKSLGQHNFQN
jgi:hypothetical protein